MPVNEANPSELEVLRQRIIDLEAENTKIKDEYESEYLEIKDDNASLETEKNELKDENAKFKNENMKLRWVIGVNAKRVAENAEHKV